MSLEGYGAEQSASAGLALQGRRKGKPSDFGKIKSVDNFGLLVPCPGNWEEPTMALWRHEQTGFENSGLFLCLFLF